MSPGSLKVGAPSPKLSKDFFVAPRLKGARDLAAQDLGLLARGVGDASGEATCWGNDS